MPSSRSEPPSPGDHLPEEPLTEALAPPRDTAAERPQRVAERLRELYGEDVDPGVSLGDEPKSETGPRSKLFERLRAEGPRGTRYRLLSEIGRGGMGAIIRVWDDELRRTLAMKVILGKGEPASGDTPAVDARTLGRFLEEAQTTGQLDHPGIVPVHELGLDATGRVYFTMRLVKGEDLRAVLVMDWGLARVMGREDKHDLRLRTGESSAPSVVKTERHDERDFAADSPLMTMDGDVVGTPSFMPPEQARGELERLGPHSDVYSIGAMLYQLLTGTMPYVPAGTRVSPHTIHGLVLHAPPPSIESLAPRTSPELVAICEKAMAREIGDRYPTTLALATDLRAYLEGRVVAAYETGTWAETRKWVQRNRPLAGSLAAALLAIVAGLVAFGIKTREANASARRADETATRAVARADALWTIQELADFRRESADREFAWSLQRPGVEWWLETARRMVDGRVADEAAGIARRPGLVDHQRLLTEIRADALPAKR